MGVPAGPKLDFVGASEVRNQETSVAAIGTSHEISMFVLDVPNVCIYYVSPLTKPKRKFDLQRHVVVKTQLFQLDSI